MSALEILGDVAEFLEDYSDVKDGDDGAPEPNKAMSLLGEVEREIERLKMQAVAQPEGMAWKPVNEGEGTAHAIISDPGDEIAFFCILRGDFYEYTVKLPDAPKPSKRPKVPYCTRHGLVAHEHRCSVFSDEPHQVIDADMLPTEDTSAPQPSES